MTPADRRPPNPLLRRPQVPTIPPRDTKSSLYEAAVAAVEDRTVEARADSARRASPRRQSPFVRIVGVLGLVGLLLLALRPSWLAGPSRVPAESEAISEASLRLVLIRERDLVLAHLQRTGRLPATLGEAGSTAEGVEYRSSGATFSLSASVGSSLIVLRDSDSTATFLGESLTRLKNRARGMP